MSRYPYGEPPPPTRWDADRFAREQDYRRTEGYYAPAAPPPRRAARPVYEEERYFREDDRYGPGGAYTDRRYFEEEGYYDPRASQGQVVPYRQARRPEAPPRPGLIRRQSSLDTFDRPPRRYDDYDEYRPPPQRPQRISVDVPEPRGPGSNRYRPAPRQQRRSAYDEYDYREYYDDVAVQDPDLYGDDGFREFREREWVRRRTRDDSGSRSHSRSRPATEAPVEEVKTEKKETIVKEEVKEEVKKEKTYPRRGKTKMPKRLVHTKVLFDLGYPFYEEGDKTLIIEKALGPENIDEVFAKSREYREAEVSTTLRLEAPPPAPPSVKSPSRAAPSVRSSTTIIREDVQEDIKETEVKTIPMSEAPRSVREWDQLTVKEDTRTTDRRKSNARPKSRRGSEVDRETIIERKSTVVEREPSPERRKKSRSKSRRRKAASESSYNETEIIERKITTEETEDFIGESESVHVGPLALVLDRNKDRDIKDQIRRLEAEQRALRRERRDERESSEFIKIERRSSPSPVREVYVDRHRHRRRRSPSPAFREVIVDRQRSPSPAFREVIVDRRRSPSPAFREVIVDRRRSPSPEFREVIVDRRRSPSPTFRQVIVDRGRSPSPYLERELMIDPRNSSRPFPRDVDHTGELIITRDGEEIIETRKDRRERSVSRARAPSAGLIRSMFYTLT